MASASDMKKKSEDGMFDMIMQAIEKCADNGSTEIDLSDYDSLFLSTGNRARLEDEDYKIDGTRIS